MPETERFMGVLLRRVGVSTAAVVLTLAWSGQAFAEPAADAPARLVDQGWWWVAQTGSTPPPPGVPADGLDVGQGPDGATAVSAVRIASGRAPGRVLLELPVAQETPAGVATLQACGSAVTWKPVQAGELKDAPLADCAALSLPLRRSDDGSRWSVDVSAFLQPDSTVSISVLPLPQPAAGLPVPVPSAFDVAFGAPRLVVTPATAATPPAPTPGPVRTPAPDPVFAAGPAQVLGLIAGLPPRAGVAERPVTPTAPVLAAPPVAFTPVLVPPSTVDGPLDPRRWPTLFFGLPMLGLVGGLLASSGRRRHVRQALLLGRPKQLA